jgi:hypothetical protein
MQAELIIKCGGCGKKVGEVKCDTADMPEELQAKVNKVILAHRKMCKYYGETAEDRAWGGV